MCSLNFRIWITRVDCDSFDTAIKRKEKKNEVSVLFRCMNYK